MSEIEILKDWKLVKLGDIGEYKYGYNGKASSDKDEKPYLRITDINEDGSLKPDRVYVQISKNDFEKYQLKNNDIVIARTGATVGKSFLFIGNDDFVFASYLIRFRFDIQKIIPKFLLYVLKSPKYWNFIGISQSISAQPNVNATKMSSFEFLLPPLETQKKIVQKLDYVLEQLEGKKKEILNINQKNIAAIKFFYKNLNRAISQHYIPLEIPQNWTTKKLLELANVGQGGTPSTSHSEYWDGDIPWLRSGELLDNIIIDSRKKISEKGLQNSSTKLCPKGTIMVAMTGQGLTRGRTCLLGINACANQSCAHIINNSQDVLTEFLWAFLKSRYWLIRSIHHGSGQPGINVSLIKQLDITFPSIIEQKKILTKLKSEKTIETWNIHLEKALKQSQLTINHLNNLSSSILDRAFSGKLSP